MDLRRQRRWHRPKKNAFFLDNRVAHRPTDAVRVEPPPTVTGSGSFDEFETADEFDEYEDIDPEADVSDDAVATGLAMPLEAYVGLQTEELAPSAVTRAVARIDQRADRLGGIDTSIGS